MCWIKWLYQSMQTSNHLTRFQSRHLQLSEGEISITTCWICLTNRYRSSPLIWCHKQSGICLMENVITSVQYSTVHVPYTVYWIQYRGVWRRQNWNITGWESPATDKVCLFLWRRIPIKKQKQTKSAGELATLSASGELEAGSAGCEI